jgi:cation:H+ antiporter
MVAFGTSLPELASCVVACIRRHTNLILGSLVGSSIFNVLAILGLTSLVKPIVISAPAVVRSDLWMMAGFGLVVLLLMIRGRRLVRWEGGVLLVLYVLYFIYLLL